VGTFFRHLLLVLATACSEVSSHTFRLCIGTVAWGYQGICRHLRPEFQQTCLWQAGDAVNVAIRTRLHWNSMW